MAPEVNEGYGKARGRRTPQEGGAETTGATGSHAVGIDDPVLATPGSPDIPGPAADPERTTALETSRVRGAGAAHESYSATVPAEADQLRQGHRPAGGEGRNADDGGDKARGGPRDDRDRHEPAKDREGGRAGSGDDHRRRSGPSQGFSLGRILLYSAAVSLACGVAGAWGYSAVFGPKKAAGTQVSSQDSGAGRSSDSGRSDASGNDPDADPGEGRGSGADSTRPGGELGSSKLLQAQAAWMAAVKELKESKAAEAEARASDRETRAVLDFFKETVLSAGRPQEGSLSETFWNGGHGQDLSLRKALDSAESRASGAFGERPMAEASVREILGQAYLGLGEPGLAVKQYERALALRQAEEGSDHPDTADCRNRLAVAYRLAGLVSEGGSLFERKPETPAKASALAVRGEALLLEKKPAEAELPLRECLTIRQRILPDDWSTFDAESALGGALAAQRKYEAAEPLLVSGYQGLKLRESAIPAEDRPRVDKARARLAELYESWGKPDEAMKWRTRAEASPSRGTATLPAKAPSVTTASPGHAH